MGECCLGDSVLCNAEPLVPEAMQVCTMENGEKYVQCQWCPCRFSNISDFNRHVKAYGKTIEKHKEDWRNRNWRHETSAEDSDSY